MSADPNSTARGWPAGLSSRPPWQVENPRLCVEGLPEAPDVDYTGRPAADGSQWTLRGRVSLGSRESQTPNRQEARGSP